MFVLETLLSQKKLTFIFVINLIPHTHTSWHEISNVSNIFGKQPKKKRRYTQVCDWGERDRIGSKLFQIKIIRQVLPCVCVCVCVFARTQSFNQPMTMTTKNQKKNQKPESIYFLMYNRGLVYSICVCVCV